MQFSESSLYCLIPLLFPLFFITIWVFVCWLLALFGGWSRLAKSYRSESTFTGKTLSLQSGRMGWVNYNLVLTIGVSEEGLYLHIMPLYRVAHPPLFIPWADVSATHQSLWMFSGTLLTFAQAPSVRLWLLGGTGERVMEGVQGRGATS